MTPNTGAPTPEAEERREPIVIALVNNMPDSALHQTERQFRTLLAAAAADRDVRLHLFSFPELIREDAGRAYVAENYENIERLWTGRFDGLIVTGAEPRTAVLSDELYWRSLARLVDWAEEHTVSTIWSCLAAHAAVLHLDGISRERYAAKLHGVFSCERIGDHQLLAGMPSSWGTPHSRLNTLDPDTLRAAGYDLVSISADAGADAFLKQLGSLFVFLQGHPEYDPGALLGEYRRDVGRYLAGTSNTYPDMPRGYFDDETTRALDLFRQSAVRDPKRELLERFPVAEARENLSHSWRAAAIQLYSNWLEYLTSHRKTTPPSSAARGSVVARSR